MATDHTTHITEIKAQIASIKTHLDIAGADLAYAIAIKSPCEARPANLRIRRLERQLDEVQRQLDEAIALDEADAYGAPASVVWGGEHFVPRDQAQVASDMEDAEDDLHLLD